MKQQPVMVTVAAARRALVWTQRELGENLGASLRTASRWEAGRSTIHADEIAKLARFVYPVRPDLAEQLAGHIGQTLVSLGLVAPPAPPVVPAPAATVEVRPERVMTTKDILDSVTYAVADAANVAPRSVRGMVLLTLRRAQELGMDLDRAAKEGALEEADTARVVERA